MKKTVEDRISTEQYLSTLWLFVLLNIIFRDIHEIFRTGFIEELISGTVNGVKLSDELLLAASIALEIPIVMVLLSRILNPRINRWLNIIAAIITIALVLSNGMKDLDDIFFISIELIALASIIWKSWKWIGVRKQLV